MRSSVASYRKAWKCCSRTPLYTLRILSNLIQPAFDFWKVSYHDKRVYDVCVQITHANERAEVLFIKLIL